MKLVVNSIPAKGLVTGIGRYVRSLYEVILKYEGVDVTFFDGVKSEKTLPPYRDPKKYISFIDRFSSLPWWATSWVRSLYWLFFEKRLQKLLDKVKASLYHEPALFPAKITHRPQVLNIHDLSLMKMDQFHPKDRVTFFRIFFKKRLSLANHIITVSEFIKGEVSDLLSVPLEKITAIPLAPSKHFYPRPSSEVRKVMEKYNLRKPFIIAVGSIDPRKNLKLVIQALNTMDYKDLVLVLVGWKGWGYKELEKDLNRLKRGDKVRLLGYVPDEDLASLYSGALSLVYPSLYEGFGLPVVEAMACGCPVICSNTSSLPEVAGNAAILIDPYDSRALAEAIAAFLENKPLREQFIHLGFYRLAHFSWEKTAEKTIQLFRSLV
ncbi:MAG: glycosyltransferase family 4 protein [Syntrophobacterales bacterium]|nr:glycosyltransferase family 4 protein [Syntrophobacterales bacterium]